MQGEAIKRVNVREKPDIPSLDEMERRAFAWAAKYPAAFAALGRS